MESNFTQQISYAYMIKLKSFLYRKIYHTVRYLNYLIDSPIKIWDKISDIITCMYCKLWDSMDKTWNFNWVIGVEEIHEIYIWGQLGIFHNSNSFNFSVLLLTTKNITSSHQPMKKLTFPCKQTSLPNAKIPWGKPINWLFQCLGRSL